LNEDIGEMRLEMSDKRSKHESRATWVGGRGWKENFERRHGYMYDVTDVIPIYGWCREDNWLFREDCLLLLLIEQQQPYVVPDSLHLPFHFISLSHSYY